MQILKADQPFSSFISCFFPQSMYANEEKTYENFKYGALVPIFHGIKWERRTVQKQSFFRSPPLILSGDLKAKFLQSSYKTFPSWTFSTVNYFDKITIWVQNVVLKNKYSVLPKHLCM